MQHVETDRRNMMQNYPDFYPLTATAVLIAIGIGIGWMLFADHDGYGMNLWTEVLSIGVTVAVIDRLNQRRAAQQRKAELIQQLGSLSNDFALEAARLLRPMGILTDGSLKGMYFRNANLSGAELQGANLSGANLGSADLSGANLWRADLSGANLIEADLSGVNLRNANLSRASLVKVNLSGVNLFGANLSGAVLLYANLSRADLRGVDLSGAHLWSVNLSDMTLGGANLSGANLSHANFNENTRLPDDSRWTPDTDMTCFTNPEHPDFWRSDDERSPAYRGNSD